MSPEAAKHNDLINQCENTMDEIFARCAENAPNFGVLVDCFKTSLRNPSANIFP